MTGLIHLLAVAALLALLSHNQDPIKLLRLEQKFQEQTDPVHQAKALAKLGPEEIREAQEEIRAGEVDQALARLQHFRDNARNVQRGLEASGINAVKKPGGFQELQIALRETVRKLRDIVFGVSLDRRAAFAGVQQDLDQVNNHLLQDLFPPPPPPPKPRKKHGKLASTVHPFPIAGAPQRVSQPKSAAGCRTLRFSGCGFWVIALLGTREPQPQST